jgi:hypothetical protein
MSLEEEKMSIKIEETFMALVAATKSSHFILYFLNYSCGKHSKTDSKGRADFLKGIFP